MLVAKRPKLVERKTKSLLSHVSFQILNELNARLARAGAPKTESRRLRTLVLVVLAGAEVERIGWQFGAFNWQSLCRVWVGRDQQRHVYSDPMLLVVNMVLLDSTSDIVQ